jgi:hypothetical protein
MGAGEGCYGDDWGGDWLLPGNSSLSESDPPTKMRRKVAPPNPGSGTLVAQQKSEPAYSTPALLAVKIAVIFWGKIKIAKNDRLLPQVLKMRVSAPDVKNLGIARSRGRYLLSGHIRRLDLAQPVS